MQPIPDLLTVSEAAERVRLSLRTLRTLIATDRGPQITRLGSRVFVRRDHLGLWIDSNGQPGRGDAA